MNIRSSDLPGVGKKVSFVTTEGDMVVLVTHHTGKRELYFFEDEDGDEVLHSISLADEESRQIGAQMIGVLYQPVEADTVRTYSKKLMMEWVKLKPGSPVIGKTLEQSKIRDKTGVSIMAITRGVEEELIINPKAIEMLQENDVVMVAGKIENIELFEEFCKGKGE